MTVTAQPVDYTDPQALKQWRESLMAFELRSVCAAAVTEFTGNEHFGAIREKLREVIDSKTLTEASKHIANLHEVIFGEGKGRKMMISIRYCAAVADTLANNLLVRSKPDDPMYPVEQRLALLYGTGILLEDLLAEIKALDELPLDLVSGARHYLIACNFKPRDFQILRQLLICETDSEFMQALTGLIEDFHEGRNMWELVRVTKTRTVLPRPPALLETLL